MGRLQDLSWLIREARAVLADAKTEAVSWYNSSNREWKDMGELVDKLESLLVLLDDIPAGVIEEIEDEDRAEYEGECRADAASY